MALLSRFLLKVDGISLERAEHASALSKRELENLVRASTITNAAIHFIGNAFFLTIAIYLNGLDPKVLVN